MLDPPTRLRNLQQWRTRPERSLSISTELAAIHAHSSRARRRLGAIIDLWNELLPGELAQHTRIDALRRGVLHVIVDSASTAFELDRVLREGLEAEIRKRYSGTLLRVKRRVGSLNDS